MNAKFFEMLMKQVWVRIHWGTSDYQDQIVRDEVNPYMDEGNAASSKVYRSEKHKVLLDLDVPAYLIPSTTEGHSHLYVDVTCEWKDYVTFLEAAAKIGMIEEKYVYASKLRGATFLRLPWVKKETIPKDDLPIVTVFTGSKTGRFTPTNNPVEDTK